MGTPKPLEPTQDALSTRDTQSADPTSYGLDLEAGDVVGDYTIERKLGHGGMGTVYAAVHPIIEKRVAVKVLRRELSDSAEAIARFVQEARAVNRIRHPSIVDVFGYGTTDDGRCFLVMELLDGESLGARLDSDPPSRVDACAILIAITHALDAAHASGIVHRDLKPDNVFLLPGQRVKLLDFGIAKLTAQSERLPADYTQPGQAIGTPRYIAPEQARGDTVDGRTDVYSLGVMAFELIVGRPPFIGDNAMELVAKHITLAPPAPTSIRPGLPPIADVLLLEMLDKEPANRPSLARVRELLAELGDAPAAAIAAATPATTGEIVAQLRGKRRWIPATLGALGLGAAIGFGVVWSARDNAEPAVVMPAVPPAPVPVPTIEWLVAKPAPVEPPAPPVTKQEEPAAAPAVKRPVVKRPAAKPAAPVTVAKPPVEVPAPVVQQPPAPTPPAVEKPRPATVDETRDGLKRPKWMPKQ